MRPSLALLAPILCIASALHAQVPIDDLGSDSGSFRHPIESYPLRHARAEHVAKILNEQFLDTVKFSADSTTNTIYGRIPQELRVDVEKFLARLEAAAEQKYVADQQAQQRAMKHLQYGASGGRPATKNDQKSEASTDANELDGPPATKNKSKTEASRAYESAEREAAKLADRWQREKQRGRLSVDELKKLRQSVSEHVSSAFHLRQKLKRDELTNAQQQLDAIKKRLDLRQAMSDKIIQRRVDELLTDTDLNWLTSEARAENELLTSDLDLPPGLVLGVRIEAMEDLGAVVLRGRKPDVDKVAQTLSVASGGDATLPRVRGEVMKRNDEKKTLLLSIGSNNGLKVGTLLDVTRKGRPIGRVQVVSVAPKDAIARIVSQNAENGIDKGDQVHVISENTEPTKIEPKSESE